MQNMFCCFFSPDASNAYLLFGSFLVSIYPFCCGLKLLFPNFPKVEKESGQRPNHHYLLVGFYVWIRVCCIRKGALVGLTIPDFVYQFINLLLRVLPIIPKQRLLIADFKKVDGPTKKNHQQTFGFRESSLLKDGQQKTDTNKIYWPIRIG